MATKLKLDIQPLKDSTLKDGEKHKLINNIINKICKHEYQKTDVESFLTADVTKEENFIKYLYISILLNSKQTEPIVRVLLSEDDLLIADVIKRCNFFWADNKYTPDFYISTIFPYVSYSQRNAILKVIERNIADEQRGELFYEKLKMVYNVSTARPFLKYCSWDFLLKSINSGEFLNQNELLAILPTKSMFVLNYLKKMTELKTENNKCVEKFNPYIYEDVLKQLFSLHIIETVEMIENSYLWSQFHLGRKLTKKFLKNSKNFVLKGSKTGSEKYNYYVILKCLSEEEFEEFLCSLFDKNYYRTRIDSTINKYLNYYKTKEEKFAVYQKCYKRVYGKELLDDSKNITLEIMKLMDNELRHKYALANIENGNTQLKADDWIQYLRTEVSIPKIKDLIYITSDSEKRKSYLSILVSTCGINNDYESFLQVLKYFNTKHRNEMIEVRLEFLKTIAYSIPLEKLDSNHWQAIEEIFEIMLLKGEIESGFRSNDLIFSAIKYNLKNDLPVEKWLTYYINFIFVNIRRNNYSILTKYPKFEKICLQKIGVLLPEVFTDTNKLYTTRIDFISAISLWNSKYPDDPISIMDYPWLIEAIKKYIAEIKFHSKENFLKLIENDTKAEEYFKEEIKVLKKEVLDHYSGDYFNIEKIEKYIEIDPNLVINKIDNICCYSLSSPSNVQKTFKLIKNNKFKVIPGFDEKFAKYCWNILDNTSTDEKKASAMRVLILLNLLNDEKFYEIVRKYYPLDKKLLKGDSTDKNKFEYQKQIACSIHKFRKHSETLEALKRFCVGDYLQLAIGSLNSVCTKLPFYKSKEFLKTCLDSPVSFKKHIIRLHCLIFDKKFLSDFLKDSIKSEKNPSIREILLKNIYNYFINEPNDITWWNLLKECIQMLTEKDKSILDTIINFKNKIPEKLYSQFCELCWNTILKLEKYHPDLKDRKPKILQAINNCINIMEPKFVESLLAQNLFNLKIDNSLPISFCDIAVRYLLTDINNEEVQKNRMKFIISKMQTAFHNDWNSLEKNSRTFMMRVHIHYFITNMYQSGIRLAKSQKKFLNFILFELKEQLKNVCDPTVFFYNHYILIELTLIYNECDRNCFEFGKHVRTILNREIQKYESYIITSFVADLNSFTNNLYNENIDKMDIARGLLDEPIQSIGCVLCALQFIKDSNLSDEKEKKAIYERLAEMDDNRIKWFFNNQNV